MTIQIDSTYLLYASIAYAAVLVLYALFTGFFKTRGLGLFFQILLGMMLIVGGVYLLFFHSSRTIPIVLIAAGALLIFIGVAFFCVHRSDD